MCTVAVWMQFTFVIVCNRQKQNITEAKYKTLSHAVNAAYHSDIQLMVEWQTFKPNSPSRSSC